MNYKSTRIYWSSFISVTSLNQYNINVLNCTFWIIVVESFLTRAGKMWELLQNQHFPHAIFKEPYNTTSTFDSSEKTQLSYNFCPILPIVQDQPVPFLHRNKYRRKRDTSTWWPRQTTTKPGNIYHLKKGSQTCFNWRNKLIWTTKNIIMFKRYSYKPGLMDRIYFRAYRHTVPDSFIHMKMFTKFPLQFWRTCDKFWIIKILKKEILE